MLQYHQNPTVEAYLKEPDIHDVRRAGVVGAGVTLVAALAAVVLHGLNAYLLFGAGVPAVVFALVHVALAGVVLMFASGLHKMGRDARFMLLLGVTTAGMGVFGALGCALTLVLHFWHMRISHSFAEWFAMIFPRPERSKPEKIFDALSFGRDRNPSAYHVIPFMDVMEIGSESQKRKALARMTEFFEPRFAPAFKKAVSDPSNAIRVQVATAISRIENQFLEELMKITRLMREYPQDAAIKLALAEHYDDYAFTGILDSERERVNRTRAMELYQEYIDLKPGDVTARIRLGRLMLRQGLSVEAADWFARCVSEGYASDSLVIWYLEALFAARRFHELRAMARASRTKLRPYYEHNPQLEESITLWSGMEQEEAVA